MGKRILFAKFACMTILILSLLNSAVAQDSSTSSTNSAAKTVKFTIPLEVKGDIVSTSVTADHITAQSSLKISDKLVADKVLSQVFATKLLETEYISSPTGIVTIVGDVVITNKAIENLKQQVSLIQTGGWNVHEEHNFDTVGEFLEEWSSDKVSSCTVGGKNKHLGGHCNFSNGKITKSYKDLPQHSNVKIKANLHFIDLWEGETAFITIDGEPVWSKSMNTPAKGINLCGGEHPDADIGFPVEIELAHSKSTLLLEFGTNGKEDACTQSLGIDNVGLYFA